MLKKAQRLNSKEVESVVRKGRRASTSLFSLHILPAHKPKIAVIIPKKLAKTSVLRHRYKRRIMAAITSYIKKYPLPQAYIMFTLRQDIAHLDFKDLCAHIEEAILKQ